MGRSLPELIGNLYRPRLCLLPLSGLFLFMSNPIQISVETEKEKSFNIYINHEEQLVILSPKAECHLVVTLKEWAIIQKYANEMISDFKDANKYAHGNNHF